MPKLAIPVTAATEYEGRPFKILGRVYTRKMGVTSFSRPSEESLLPRLMKPAKALGADAILGVQTGTRGIQDGGERYRWVSGMAVRFEAGADSTGGMTFDNLVAVVPCAISDSIIPKPEKRAKTIGWLQLGATYYLEEHGYFTRACSTGAASAGVEALNAMDDATWREQFGPWVGKVLLTRLVAKGTSNIGIASNNEVELDAELYSRNERKIVWQGDASGSSFQLGPLEVLLGSGYRESLHSTIRKLLKQLPVVGDGE